VNQFLVQAQLAARDALRYTPAGLPALDVRLEHESTQVQEASVRKVTLELRGRAVGSVTQALAEMPLGANGVFSGFLSSQRSGRGIVFHITQVQALAPEPL
jgi:primosomal replication protein N